MKNYPVAKNQEIEVEIIDLSHEGNGIAKVDGYLLFIENTLPKEKVIAKVLKVGNKFGFAKVMQFLETSPDRQELPNEALLRTGIAPLSHLSYDKQLLFKQQQVENVLTKIAKLEVPVLAPISMTEPFGYRNKAQIPVQKINGALTTGFYRKNSHTLVPIEDFYIQDPEIDQAIITIRDILQRFNVKAYNEEAHEGFLRHIVVRRGHHSGEMMVVLVTRKPKFFKGEEIATVIHDEIPAVVSVIQNINEEKTNVILGEFGRVLYGKETIEDQLLGKTFQISAKSFYQVNTEMTEVLYQKAFEMAQLKPEDIVVDAYAGIGTIGISLADQVSEVLGMEVIPEAVNDAKANAKRNGVDNVHYFVGKAEKIMPQWLREGIQPTVVFVDPPRKGLDASFIETTAAVGPERIVYISCNPATLARDLALFAEQGYETKQVQPVDLFPQTTHVETVVLMSRVDK
ncbi:23S rRNA (uracil(1939)-C(5))-methyltransferase RlmD [Enterococcus sp.]|uniref:23S rRNA (uracil(1939)-C(5))-methyltransferase RlmD n=1 Tax=Enterococcus sp. TaxID=35783 RepID=UPI0028969FFF|nr:23S rRNA (uracil(1939)-C(5))-methyltransferase RlmD [Enterococcus sp.]